MYLAGIGTRAEHDPHGVAIRDRAGVLTWAQVAEQVRGAAASMLALAPECGPDARVGVTGDNAPPP